MKVIKKQNLMTTTATAATTTTTTTKVNNKRNIKSGLNLSSLLLFLSLPLSLSLYFPSHQRSSRSLLIMIVLFSIHAYASSSSSSSSHAVRCCAFQARIPKASCKQKQRRFFSSRTFCTSRLFTTASTTTTTSLSSSTNTDNNNTNNIQSVGIVGGGLAGLSTAFHLLQKSPSLDITIFDKTTGPGLGGASSVAGGLLHPLSPRGKLVYLGLEGLTCTNVLIDAAASFEEGVVLRNDIWRIALTEAQVKTLKKTASDCSEFAQWYNNNNNNNEVPPSILFGNDNDSEILGVLRLHSGCKVVHVPTYLKGLWRACESIGTGTKEWKTVTFSSTSDQTDNDTTNINYLRQTLSDFDAVVLAAGSGIFQDALLSNNFGNDDSDDDNNDNDDLPVTLVRGQSIELKFSKPVEQDALLCGKYVSPLPDKQRILIGATHEFGKQPLSPESVETELKEKTIAFASEIWNNDTGEIDQKITSGYRVQSRRGRFGRLPIVGRINNATTSTTTTTNPLHNNAWIFTGLSSRGLLYHGVYGEILSSSLLGCPSSSSTYQCSEMDWWRKK